MDTSITRYPLSWPAGWKRTPRAKIRRSLFKIKSIARAVAELNRELGRLGAQNVIISTNLTLRNDGLPRADQRMPDDRGVAVYFLLAKQPRVLACDAWLTIEENLWSIAKHVEAIRAQERYQVGTLEQAFRGYDALPAPANEAEWWTVLNVERTIGAEQLKRIYYALARSHHPDVGGDGEKFKQITRAYEAGLKEIEGREARR